MKIGNTTYNVEWLKSVTLTEAKKTQSPNIEQAWREVNKEKATKPKRGRPKKQ